MYKYASDILSKTILPYVLGVHGLNILYPANLIRESVPVSKSGSVIFRLDERGSLIAEYFAYDLDRADVWRPSQSPSDVAISIRLVDTGVELPTRSFDPSSKTTTIYTNVAMPLVEAFECIVSGWIGDPSVEMKSAVATLDGCAVLPLRSLGERSFVGVEERDDGPSFRSYHESRNSEVVELTAGGWETSIHSLSEDKRDSLSDEPPYSISIRRSDRSGFQLSEESDVLRLLILLLSLSSERWIQYSTIHCRVSGARPDVVNRALVGRLASRGWSERREVSMLELRDWPVMFKGLWDSRESPQMLSALIHLISCGDRSKHGSFSYQDLVDAHGALEAAVRLWNDLPPNHFFRGKGASSLKSQLRRVVAEFRMGGRVLNRDEVIKVVPEASEYRHTLAHGSGGDFHRSENEDLGRLIAHQQYLYHLARLLVLAKLGGSSGCPGFPYYAPSLIAA